MNNGVRELNQQLSHQLEKIYLIRSKLVPGNKCRVPCRLIILSDKIGLVPNLSDYGISNKSRVPIHWKILSDKI